MTWFSWHISNNIWVCVRIWSQTFLLRNQSLIVFSTSHYHWHFGVLTKLWATPVQCYTRCDMVHHSITPRESGLAMLKILNAANGEGHEIPSRPVTPQNHGAKECGVNFKWTWLRQNLHKTICAVISETICWDNRARCCKHSVCYPSK